jgi:hypothetical protein
VREIHRQIREAGFVPAQRNTAYEVLRTYRDPEDDEALPPDKALETGSVIPLATLN